MGKVLNEEFDDKSHLCIFMRFRGDLSHLRNIWVYSDPICVYPCSSAVNAIKNPTFLGKKSGFCPQNYIPNLTLEGFWNFRRTRQVS